MHVDATPPATLRLRGHEPVPARVELVRRSTRTRATQALLTLLATAVIAPVAALLPPHVPWALAALAVGGYYTYRRWTGEYEVRAFEGACPRCGAALPIEPGTRIRLPHRMSCYACHHDPTLTVGAPPA